MITVEDQSVWLNNASAVTLVEAVRLRRKFCGSKYDVVLFETLYLFSFALRREA